MVDEGIGGVKIQRLCDRLGVTKGSFYWHFADLDAFLGEVARRWAEDGARCPARSTTRHDPEARLLLAMRLFADPRNRNLARAMRDWAQNDERARAAIRKADEAHVRAGEGGARAPAASTTPRPRCGPRSSTTPASATPTSARSAAGTRPSEQLAATWEILTQPNG